MMTSHLVTTVRGVVLHLVLKRDMELRYKRKVVLGVGKDTCVRRNNYLITYGASTQEVFLDLLYE